MGRHRSRSYSPRRRGRSRSPPHNRGKYYDDPRDRRRSHQRLRSPPPSGLLVRNIPLDTRPEELRNPFEKFGPVKDVYLPRDYYTGEPRGFGFVKFRYPEDAAKAKDKLNYTDIGGREIRIVYAEENRKTPREMRNPGHTRYEGRRRTPVRSPRRRYHSCSRSPVTERRALRSVSRSPSHHIKRGRSRSPFSKRDGSSSPLSEQVRSQTPRPMSTRKGSPDGKEYKRGVLSPSPRDTESRDGKRHKLSERSHSPRQMSSHEDYQSCIKSRDVSPRDEKVFSSPKKSVSPHDDDFQPPRRSSKRSRDISPHDEKVLRSSKRSVSPHVENYQSSKRSTDISPRDEKILRSSKRSVSPRRESPLGNDSSDEREHQREVKSSSPRNIKSHDGSSYKSSQRHSSPRVMYPDGISRKTGSRDTSFSNGIDLRSSAMN